jgi:hypothetical protein
MLPPRVDIAFADRRVERAGATSYTIAQTN